MTEQEMIDVAMATTFLMQHDIADYMRSHFGELEGVVTEFAALYLKRVIQAMYNIDIHEDSPGLKLIYNYKAFMEMQKKIRKDSAMA